MKKKEKSEKSGEGEEGKEENIYIYTNIYMYIHIYSIYSIYSVYIYIYEFLKLDCSVRPASRSVIVVRPNKHLFLYNRIQPRVLEVGSQLFFLHSKTHTQEVQLHFQCKSTLYLIIALV